MRQCQASRFVTPAEGRRSPERHLERGESGLDPDADAGSGMASEKSFDPDGAGMTRQGCVHTMFLLRLCSAHRFHALHYRTRIWLADGMPCTHVVP